jgi:hypothetical protein
MGVAVLDDDQPRRDALADDLLDGGGHRRARLAGADDDHAVVRVQVVRAVADGQAVAVACERPADGLARLDGGQ